MARGFIVAIDGPAGAGKSTVSRQLAQKLGGVLLDTGGMYRTVALFAIKSNIKKSSELGKLARSLKFDIDLENKILLVDSQDLGSKLRTEEVSAMASFISKYKHVRTVLTQKQRVLGRRWSKKIPVVVEGRDIGTVVFPNVPFKFFVTAKPEVRAKRRLLQLKRQGVRGISLRAVMKLNDERDRQDTERKIAPLRCPEDAVVVDTSSMGISQVATFMRDHIRGHLEMKK
jgi:cytidylate kinase